MLAAGKAADTIFALATGPGKSAIAIIRLSGLSSGGILGRLCGSLPTPRRATLRELRDGGGSVLDRALILWMPAPASYTGEDTAELHLHGGLAVIQAVLQTLLEFGGRPADAGEFTRRAFLAGRMDLLEAEAIGDLAEAETETQRMQALRQLQGGRGHVVSDWSKQLTQCLSLQEALIDFPDEDLPFSINAELTSELEELTAGIDRHLASAPVAERVRRGLTFTVCGAPNVGKSSIFNALAGRDVAIVSPIPGTTRDAIEVRLDLGGVAVTLVDTAGLRDADDAVEREGIRRAHDRMQTSDLVLNIVEAADGLALLPAAQGFMHVISKIDLAPPPAGIPGVSAVTGEGLPLLINILTEQAILLTRSEDDPILFRARHVAALRDTRRHLAAALEVNLPELRAEELRFAVSALGRLTGTVHTEDILDVVFGTFCIGK